VIDKGYLITIREFGATVALTPDLAWQLRFIYLRKAKLFKKGWLIGQTKDSGNTKLISFLEAGFHYLGASPLLPAVISHRQ